ncbi:MAG: hypothetical protein H6738_10320 [Alphaproteobacteria bacterium]|nr:hypothetical protein [Alphaproteobacteria bacterium]MCB9697163.1 hypothetical protein [Alphaproteobacteria bacterium]
MDLDSVDWASLEHAYGKADDVPDMLRGMVDPARTAAAFEAFDAAVNHQGWATPAAAPSLPFLIAALDAPGVPLARLVALLADLSLSGNHESWLGERLRVGAPSELRDPVLAAHARFVALLGHPEADVRAAAALAVGVLHERAVDGLPAVRAALAGESSAEARASLLLALGALGEPGDVTALDLGKRPGRPVKVAAACARIWLAPEVDQADLAYLLNESDKGGKRLKGLWWAGGDVSALADAVAMGALPRLDGERLKALLGEVAGPVEAKVAGAVAARVFPEGGAFLAGPDALSDDQRLALELAAAGKVKLHLILGDRLHAAGAPRSEAGVEVWAGLSAPGPLDAPVPGGSEPLWRVLRAAFLGRTEVPVLPLEVALGAVGALLGDRSRFADVAFLQSPTVKVGEDRPHQPNGRARLAWLLAELVAPFGEAARAVAEAHAAEQLGDEYPDYPEALFALVVLSRLGELDERWDPLLGRCMRAPPAYRAPELLVPILAALPTERREALVCSVALVDFSGSRTESGGRVVFEWRSAWVGEGWWFLPASPTPGGARALADAVRTWTTLPPVPTEIPKGCFAAPHAPFPMVRFRELVDAWGPESVRAALAELPPSPLVDELRTMSAG